MYEAKPDIVKIPDWSKELKVIIQDQINTNLSLSLTAIYSDLNINPAYVSREFTSISMTYHLVNTSGNYVLVKQSPV